MLYVRKIGILITDGEQYSTVLYSNRWHELTVRHAEQSVDVTLDSTVEKMSLNKPDVRLHLPPYVYFGGMDVSASMLGMCSFIPIDCLALSN